MPLVSRTFDQLIDFTRTSSATFVGSNGLVQSTPASRNLLTFTQEFDNAAWSKTSTTVTANSTAAPDGTMTGDALVATAGTSARNCVQTAGGSGSALTLSLYAKAGTSNFVQLYHASSGTIFANFNLATGAVGTVGTGATAAITSVDNGWYRCSITFTPGSSGASRIGMITSGTAAYAESWTAAGTETIFIWGAQLELGSTATDYTRNFGGLFPPRFDYDPVTLAPRGLLIEEQRTNLLLRSEEFDNAAWTKSRATVTANATTSPDGTADADKLVEDTTATATHRVFQQASKAASSLTRTFSVYLKAAERTFARVTVSDNTEVVNARTDVDLSAGTVTAASVAGGSTISAASASIAPAGNGWYRVSITATFDATITNPGAFVFICNSLSGISYTGDGISGLFVWGAQWEDGAFATSYIPTVASQVTRTADTALIQAPNFAPWYRQSEGTLLVEWGSSTTNSLAVANLSDGTSNNRITVQNDNGFQGAILVGGAAQASLDGGTIGAINKVAFAFKANDFALSLGGGAAVTDASGSMPTVDRLILGANGAGSASFLNGHIRSIRYYPVRLSDAQLQALTA